MAEKIKKRILLVDDSPFVLEQLADDLGHYSVVTAESGEEAVEVLKVTDSLRTECEGNNPFDLIITDLLMPGMNGFDLAKFVRQLNKVNKFTPVILLTTQNVCRTEARRNGCVASFSKADKQKMLGVVNTLLSC